jgi:hypothetical protein
MNIEKSRSNALDLFTGLKDEGRSKQKRRADAREGFPILQDVKKQLMIT